MKECGRFDLERLEFIDAPTRPLIACEGVME
jgi:hypothetical protein